MDDGFFVPVTIDNFNLNLLLCRLLAVFPLVLVPSAKPPPPCGVWDAGKYSTVQRNTAKQTGAHTSCLVNPPANEDQKFTALLFPVDGEEPKLSEIDFKIVKDALGDVRHKIGFTPLFGPKGRPKSYPVMNHGYYGAPLGRSLYIFINDNFFNDGSPLNKCIARLAPGGHPWGGNVFVLRGREPLYKYPQYYNAKMEDLAPAIQYLKDYGERARSLSYD